MDDRLFSVAEQAVLVSGGSRRIGRAIAAGFAERGARVIHVDGVFSAGWCWPSPE